MSDDDTTPTVSFTPMSGFPDAPVGPAGGDFVPGVDGGPPTATPILPSGLSHAEVARLGTLIPAAYAAHASLIMAMVARGMLPFIGSCSRTPAQQAAAVASGASSANEKIDWHEIKRAVDYRARLADGSEDLTTHNEPFFQALSEEAGKIPGMRSLAYHADGSKRLLNGHIWDAGHVEYRAPYATLLAAVRAEAPELLA